MTMAYPTELKGAPVKIASLGGDRIPVWDPIVRLFHWIVVVGVLLNYFVLDTGKSTHQYVGYVVAGVLVVRLIWGVIGSRHARFADFVTSPQVAMAHLAAALRRHDRRYIGHNPAGGVMIIALMALLAAVSVTGWMQGLDQFWGVEWLQEVHSICASLIVILAGLHIAAAIVESIVHRENLILSMITGLKRAPSEADVDHARSAGGR